MAKAPDLNDKRLEKLEEEITDTTLPSGSAEQPQSALLVQRMKDVYGKMAKAEGKVEAVCESCSLTRKAIAFCRQNQLYVSEYDNKLVRIFDTDCNVVGTIPTNECPCTYDIAEGDDGLYVVGNNRIGVYSCAPNGDFIRHLNIKPSSVKLSNPRGICFDSSGHLFVTERKSGVQGVHVVTTSGKHLATFGLASSGVSIGCPAGIVIDEDGFVYVCAEKDNWSNTYMYMYIMLCNGVHVYTCTAVCGTEVYR